MENKLYLRKLVICSMFIVLITIGAFIKIPIPYIPFTLQFLFVVLAGSLLGGKLGGFTVLMYVFMGLVGLPMFTEGGGFMYVLKPTFGYLIGFILCAMIVGYLVKKDNSPSVFKYYSYNFIGLLVVYLIGISYCYLVMRFYLHQSVDIKNLIFTGFLLALPGDVILSIISAVLTKKLKSVADKYLTKENVE